MKTALFIQSEAHLVGLEDILSFHKECEVIAVGADIEFLLEKKGIPFVSAYAMRATAPTDRLVFSKQLGRSALQKEGMPFFQHRGIHFGAILTPGLQYYLSRFLYHLDIVISVLEQPYEKVLLHELPDYDILAPGILDTLNASSLSDAIRLVCTERDIDTECIPTPKTSPAKKHITRILFTSKRALFCYALKVLNTYVTITAPQKKIRILASEYWKNIEPLMSTLPEAELLLVDRLEAFSMGFSAIKSHRAQFVQSADFTDRKIKKNSREKAEAFKKAWNDIKEKQVSTLDVSFRGYSVAPVLERAIDQMVYAGEKLVGEVDSMWKCMEQTRPDVVMVRAGSSAQIHFGLLCEVARSKGIPSVEIQHGVLSTFKGDFTDNPVSEYIAEYGPIVRTELEAHNFAPRSTFVDIGSPRFDVYANQQNKRRPSQEHETNIVHFAPAFGPGSWNDTYDVIDYYKHFLEAVRNVSHAHIIFKLRPGRTAELFLREIISRWFANIPHTIVQFEPLVNVLADADIVVSYHSTALLEALLSGKPVIYDAILPIYTEIAKADLTRQVTAHALIVAKTQSELNETVTRLSTDEDERTELGKRAESFMKEQYLFSDGMASKRLADLIRDLVKKKKGL